MYRFFYWLCQQIWWSCECLWWLDEYFCWFIGYPWQFVLTCLLPKSLTYAIISHGFIRHMWFRNQYYVDREIFHLFFIFITPYLWFLYVTGFIFHFHMKIFRLKSTCTLFPIHWHPLFLFVNFRFHVFVGFELIHIDRHKVSLKLLNYHQQHNVIWQHILHYVRSEPSPNILPYVWFIPLWKLENIITKIELFFWILLLIP